jgi:uncharacterized protein
MRSKEQITALTRGLRDPRSSRGAILERGSRICVPVKIISLLMLIALLIAFAGCSDQPSSVTTEQAAPAKEMSPEEKKVAEWQKAAAQGQADAQYNLGVMYAKGEGVPYDAGKAVEWYEKAAAQGHADAQCRLGVAYATGKGLPKDATKAVEWYEKAAAQGHAAAQYLLGCAHDRGEGVPKNDIKAVEWYEKAASKGVAAAQFRLGVKYDFGEGIPKDAGKAFEWYEKAASQNLAEGQFALGVAYANGEGLPKDATKAVEWYEKAAGQGHDMAQYMLGCAYSSGEGAPKNDIKAVEWYEKAAVQGNSDAQSNLGASYEIGQGTVKDLVIAYAWYNLAAAKGDEFAKHNRDRVEDKLTAAERSEGQRLAYNWKPGALLTRKSTSAVDSSTKPDKGKEDAPKKRMTGSGFVTDTSGHILTNHHVIEGYTDIRISGREGPVKVLATDMVNDLALLQIPSETKHFAVLSPEPQRLKQGEEIVVYGYPLNAVLSSGGNLTLGVVSALTGLGNNTNQIQITAPIQPGSSGSPVLNKKGHVVGVISMKLSDAKMAKATGSVPQNVNFAINAQTVRSFLDANKVPYRTGSGFFASKKGTADIAEEARKWTVVVECWR